MRDIEEILPHRFPFLMVDRVLELEKGIRAKGLKNVSINEPFFQGHFPKEKVMPGVMIIECLAQMCAVMYGGGDDDGEEAPADQVGYLAKIKNMKFYKKVVPGDQLVMEAKLDTEVGNLLIVKAKATVMDELVASGTLVVSRKGA